MAEAVSVFAVALGGKVSWLSLLGRSVEVG